MRKKSTNWRVGWSLVVVLALLLSLPGGLVPLERVAASEEAASVFLHPPSQPLAVGEQTTVDIKIANVSDLYGAEVHLAFDSTLIRVVDADLTMDGVQITPSTDFFDFRPDQLLDVDGRRFYGAWAEGVGGYFIARAEADNAAGTISYVFTLLGPALPVSVGPEDKTLATITFERIGVGDADITFINPVPGEPPVKLADAAGLPIAILPANIHGAVIMQEAIQVPAITLAPTSGVPGTVVTVTGVGFPANAPGVISAPGVITPVTFITTPDGAIPATVVTILPDAPEGEQTLTAAVGDVTATATFDVTAVPPARYILTVTVDPLASGTVSLSPEQPADGYEAGTVVTPTAEPAEGFRFDRWSGDLIGTDPAMTLTMDADKSVTAHFAVVPPRYTLTVNVDPPASGTVSLDPLQPEEGYLAGTEVTLTAVPAEGFRFDHWSGDLIGTDPTVMLTMDADKSVTAHFTAVVVMPPPPPPVEDWKVGMSITTEPHIGAVTPDIFGFGAKDGATDAWVVGDGDVIAPPPPIAGVAAYFYYPKNPQLTRKLGISIVAPAQTITWPLVIRVIRGEDALMTISWRAEDIAKVPARYVMLVLQDDVGNTLADMRIETSHTFAVAPDHEYRFRIVASELVSFELHLRAGWNMISLPLDPIVGSPAELLPHAVAVFAWDPDAKTYKMPAELVPGKGYWALVFEDVTQTIWGTPVADYSFVGAAGWHMIGSIWVDGKVYVITGLVSPHLFTWDPGVKTYTVTKILETGKGYWFLALTDFGARVLPVPPAPPEGS